MIPNSTLSTRLKWTGWSSELNLQVRAETNDGNTLASATGLRDYEMGEFTWHPSRPNEVWVGSMGGPYVSRDGGRSWSAARVGMPGGQRFCYAAPIEKVTKVRSTVGLIVLFSRANGQR